MSDGFDNFEEVKQVGGVKMQLTVLSGVGDGGGASTAPVLPWLVACTACDWKIIMHSDGQPRFNMCRKCGASVTHEKLEDLEVTNKMIEKKMDEIGVAYGVNEMAFTFKCPGCDATVNWTPPMGNKCPKCGDALFDEDGAFIHE